MTAIIDAPAPWQLQGSGYISLLQLPAASCLPARGFVPPALQTKQQGSLGMMMFVDYSDSPVGPYHELLFIPGRFAFADGCSHFSISRIFVSSMDSVVNGQRNWGIPKELANFEVDRSTAGRTLVRLHQQNRTIAELSFRHGGPSLPVPRGIIPRAWRTLGQLSNDKTYIYQPDAAGRAQWARLQHWHSDPAQFPDLQQARVLASVHLNRFDMCFPVARIIE